MRRKKHEKDDKTGKLFNNDPEKVEPVAGERLNGLGQGDPETIRIEEEAKRRGMAAAHAANRAAVRFAKIFAHHIAMGREDKCCTSDMIYDFAELVYGQGVSVVDRGWDLWLKCASGSVWEQIKEVPIEDRKWSEGGPPVPSKRRKQHCAKIAVWRLNPDFRTPPPPLPSKEAFLALMAQKKLLK